MKRHGVLKLDATFELIDGTLVLATYHVVKGLRVEGMFVELNKSQYYEAYTFAERLINTDNPHKSD